ncbi:MAG: hypothetical protein NVSMB27_08910 [Ktedonobacteraceae bacterium]
MKKRRYKKLKTKKPEAVSNSYTHIHWGWLVAGLAVIITCLILAVNAASQGKAPTDDSTVRPPVTGTMTTLPFGGSTAGVPQTTGIFALSTGGPIPVPANVLSPSNIARVVVTNVLTSIYAGCMTRAPATGALAILRENLTSGQQSLHLYQTSQPVGTLTILAVHNDILTLSTPKARGIFNLKTDEFHF